MRRNYNLFIGLAFAPILASAQLIIPAGGYTVTPPPDTLKGATVSGFGIQIPSSGPNQVWDYSAITTGTPFSAVWDAPDNNPNFPDATAFRLFNPNLGPLALSGSKEYYITDASGVFNLGIESATNTYPIGALTGGSSDVLAVAGSASTYGRNYPIVEFPMNYTDVYYPQVINTTNFNLTVAGFGLNGAPGQIVQYISGVDTILGWGALTVGANGMENVPGLLKRTTLTIVDSIFLGGAPAPTALLTAFGLTQGGISTSTEYRIFVYDGQSKTLPALTFFMDASGSAVQTVRFDRAPYSNLSTSNVALREAVKLYPNPAVENFLTVEMTQINNENLDVQIINMNGQVVTHSHYEKGASNILVDLQKCAPGNYYVKVSDKNGNLKALKNFVKL